MAEGICWDINHTDAGAMESFHVKEGEALPWPVKQTSQTFLCGIHEREMNAEASLSVKLSHSLLYYEANPGLKDCNCSAIH